MQQLLDDGIRFIFGPGSSAMFVPAYESVAGEDVEIFTAASAATGLLTEEPGSSRSRPRSSARTAATSGPSASWSTSTDPQTVAILTDADDTGELNTQEYTEALERNGSRWCTRLLPGRPADFARSYITAMAAEDPDLVVTGNVDAQFEPFLAQAIQAGFTEPVFQRARRGHRGVLGGGTGSASTGCCRPPTSCASDDPAVVEVAGALRRPLRPRGDLGCVPRPRRSTSRC